MIVLDDLIEINALPEKVFEFFLNMNKKIYFVASGRSCGVLLYKRK
ncbi:MAG: hypothetical protein GYA51_09165 [Candidatus Methanofastidiosa archaeon]|jgi:hypothetical protein|nr:hypothetical protein [Candidatus Methanofastidiosa archaeon]